MDWQALRNQLVTAAKEFTDYGGTLDGLSQSLIDFIPFAPSDAADEKWLKARGWVKTTKPGLLMNVEYGIQFEVVDGVAQMRFMCTNVKWRNPTRMAVALFEAALREAMKHGE